MNKNECDFDVFLSYNWDHKAHVQRLYDYLTIQLKLKVWIDDKELGITSLSGQLADAITNSRVFICCITAKYSESENCKNEYGLASLKRKPIIILMLERFDDKISPEITIQINNKRRFNCYNDMKSVEDFINGDNLKQAIKSLLDTLLISNADILPSSTNLHVGHLKNSAKTIQYKNGDSYVGDLKDGLKHGKGIYKYVSGDVYEGDFKDDLSHGKGIYKWASGNVYEGDYKDDKKNGKGIYKWEDGNVYEGDYKYDKKNGKGIYKWADGDVYEGDFKDDLKHGKGIYKYVSGDVYEGDFKDNLSHGKGIYKYVSGNVYEGDYKDDKKNGKGILKDAKGTVLYQGDWKDGNQNH